MTKASKPAETRQEQDSTTIEQHAARLKVPAWQAAALKARKGWPVAKRISQADYKSALDAMLKGHTDGSVKLTEKGGDE